MKGGTAINLFVQDMPRLSVDIDVVYANHTQPRAEALGAPGCARKVPSGLMAGAMLMPSDCVITLITAAPYRNYTIPDSPLKGLWLTAATWFFLWTD